MLSTLLLAVVPVGFLLLITGLVILMKWNEAKALSKLQVVPHHSQATMNSVATSPPNHDDNDQASTQVNADSLDTPSVVRTTTSGSTTTFQEENETCEKKKKKILYEAPEPVPVKQLVHFNALQTAYMTFKKKNQRSVQLYESAFRTNDFRPVLTFFGKVPIMHFASPSAARVFFMKWKELEKDNAIIFGKDFHKFVGINVVFANGDVWRRQRSVITPAFNEIERFMDVFVDKAQKSVSLLEDMFQEKGMNELLISPLDVTTRLALDVLGQTIFDVNFDYLSQIIEGPNSHAVKSQKKQQALEAYHHVMCNLLNPERIILGKAFTSLPLETNRKMENAIQTFRNFLEDLIVEFRNRKQEEQVYKDAKQKTLLELMVEAVDEEGAALTNEELKNQCAIFFLAGHETTASAMASLFYSLAKYPHVQEKLLEEISNTFSHDENISNYTKLQNMNYLDCVLKENMRLFPPITQLPLRVLNSSQIIEGYKLPKGFVVALNIFALHRNTQVWGQDAEVFRPERFMENLYPPFSLAYFGGGPRLCLGKQFSLLEQKSFIISLLQRFKIELSYPDQVMSFNKTQPGLAHEEGFKLKLVKRKL
ncbi:hypothetical protein C9374_011760 [Naegleria lovaniensis]|uniref:Cytochrome P450 n=1 Tax=Naegleria lovaniensis TaxID=51637 RepID=A0AA88G9C1_NAELO|nr:uncharacterized protein C9374_011760 [Naegleria lovaniensis]KAG2373875.1 hypothetical protein C9374_011760 [Naegleria lovaniensis]